MTDWLEKYRGYILLNLAYLVLIGGLIFLIRRPQPEPIRVIPPTPQPTPTVAKMAVYISGAVVRPGVYSLPEGARVDEAIEAAGGPTGEADLDRVNLAKRVSDEEHIYVPLVGEESLPVPLPAASPGLSGGKININTATAAELDTLPGIGPTYAQRIIEYREQNGPFQRIEDIKKVRGIGEATFEKIKDMIVVK